MKEMFIQGSWEISKIWNDSLLSFDSRTLEKRDYIYASELGKSYIDRYLKMMATPYSNPPNDRSLRKFQAGNIWEWIVGFVLKRAGLVKEFQHKFRHSLGNGLLEVSGKIDYIAGGVPDWDKADFEITKLDLPEYLYYASREIVRNLQQKYGEKELASYVYEIKSVSSFVYERLEKTKRYSPHNALQTLNYSLGAKLPGKLYYICRDDCRMIEFDINPMDAELQNLYRADIEQMSKYFLKKKRPPVEDELLFEEGVFRFRHNWQVEYSPYLSLLYGYKNPDEFRKQYASTASQYNRVFNRCVECKNMTKANLDVIKEAKKKFKGWDRWVENAKIAKAKGELQLDQQEDEN